MARIKQYNTKLEKEFSVYLHIEKFDIRDESKSHSNAMIHFYK